MSKKNIVIIGLVGSVVDAGSGPTRWQRWRPTVSLARHAEELPIARFELIYQKKFESLTRQVTEDLQHCSPKTDIRHHIVEMANPWDFEEVYSALLDFARDYPFNPEREEYLVHITTGTHVAQICLFLLTEARYFPAKLIQSAPPPAAVAKADKENPGSRGGYTIIDLDLSKYDRIASRFAAEQTEGRSFLKGGIETRNPAFNKLIEHIERVAINSKSPVLLMGPTGAGKSQLAKRIYELKKSRHQLGGGAGGSGSGGAFVEVNCATIRGDAAMSALFGHTKGAFTGAVSARPGLLRAADGGVLLLDEIGELRLDEQAMLLRALEEKRFLPVGSDSEVQSDFQLIAGTNRDLAQAVDAGEFREDLFARINLWTFRLPALKDRREDIEPNIAFELQQFARTHGRNVTFNKEARDRFLAFAISPAASWRRNFRDLNAAISRMCTLAGGGGGAGACISLEVVEEEIRQLQQSWHTGSSTSLGTHSSASDGTDSPITHLFTTRQLEDLDLFDRIQLTEVLRICAAARSISDAGRELFAASRRKKKSPNDADRLRKYLARFNIEWTDIHPE